MKALLTLLVVLYSTSAFSHTAIGNGGNVVEAYLNETRVRLMTITNILLKGDPDLRSKLCVSTLTKKDQIEGCRKFIYAVLPEFLALHDNVQRTPFVLSTSPVYVSDQNGNPVRVAAKTMLGPVGDITFDYDLIASRSPRLMMALLAHESGHKSKYVFTYQNKPYEYVDDFTPLEGFASGRDLLDSIGLELADFAVRQGVIGDAFSILDHFVCSITFADSPHSATQTGTNSRDILPSPPGADPFASFRFGIGAPRYWRIYVPEPNTCLALRINANEQDNCKAAHDPAKRNVELKVLRLFYQRPGEEIRPPEVLKTTVIEDWNPACEDDPAQMTRSMQITSSGVTFTCKYKGAIAVPYLRTPPSSREDIPEACP